MAHIVDNGHRHHFSLVPINFLKNITEPTTLLNCVSVIPVEKVGA